MAIKFKNPLSLDILDIKNIYVKISDNAEEGIKSIKWVYQKIGDNIVLVWSIIREAFSAFGAGFWQNDKPWSNDDGWKK